MRSKSSGCRMLSRVHVLFMQHYAAADDKRIPGVNDCPKDCLCSRNIEADYKVCSCQEKERERENKSRLVVILLAKPLPLQYLFHASGISTQVTMGLRTVTIPCTLS